jgi:hypothetical protein
MKRILALAVLATAALAPAVFSQTPLADHHAHLLSPASVKLTWVRPRRASPGWSSAPRRR